MCMRKDFPAYHILAAQHHLTESQKAVVQGDKTSCEIHMKLSFIHIGQYFENLDRDILEEIEKEDELI